MAKQGRINSCSKPMPVKVVNPIAGVTLYFCPFCAAGHMLEENQEVCECCGTKIIWNQIKKGGK